MKYCIPVKSKYSPELLAEAISELEFQEEMINLSDYFFDFEDAVVDCTGFITAIYDYDSGSYYAPPVTILRDWTGWIESVEIGYEDRIVTLNSSEIEDIEKRLHFA